MKLEYIEKVNDKGDNIVRLYDFNCLQADKFRKAVQQIIVENKQELALTGIDFIQSINCELILRIDDKNEGIIPSNNKTFYCNLTLEGYKEMIKLLVPFCQKESNGYQWLYDIDTITEFLFSPNGTW